MSVGHVVPVHLRCEYRENPVGVGEVKPRLSWIPETTDPLARGCAQSAWQVQVTNGSFDAPTHWDSGVVRSSQCAQVEYAGSALGSGERVQWRVRLWDEKEAPSEWSPVASWRMGLLGASDWKAQWIEAPAGPFFNWCKWVWHPDEPAPEQGAKAGTIVLTQRVTIPNGERVAAAWALLAADDAFRFHVNGVLVGTSDGEVDSWRRPSQINLMGALKEGENLLAIVATNATDGAPAAVTGKIVIRLERQHQILMAVDDSWKVSSADSREKAEVSRWEESLPVAKVIHPVGMGDLMGQPLKFWGVPGNADALVLPPPGNFRREFDLKVVPSDAVLHASALGLYEVSINGHRVGSDAFTPGWSDYHRRVYANSYEVACLLKPGRNVITAILTEGWYSGYLGWARRRNHYGCEPKLLVQLNAGSEILVATDASWRVSKEGPLREADLLMGETYDARRAWDGWQDAGWTHATLQPVVLSDAPSIPVECYPSHPVRVTEEVRAVTISEPRPGTFVFDMGQNFTGVVRVRAEGPEGAVITLRFSEVLTDTGELYTEALRGARARDQYIKRSDAPEIWQPRFTFHGFRFVEVTGLSAAPTLDAVTGLVLHSFMERSGELRTSSEMVNKLAENIRWGQRGNFLDIPTDCPQRDERLGWTGDAQIFIRTATFQFDVAAFFTKWLRDLFDAQRPEGWICMVAPAIDTWPNADSGSAAWMDAAIICPWTLYRVYGDRRVVERYWSNMVLFMDHLERTSRDLIRPNEGFGDWVSLNADTPKDLLGTAYFAYDALLMSEMAGGIGRDAEAKRYAKLYEEIRAAFQREFIEPRDGGLRGRTQCAYVLALRFGLLPEDLRPAATAFLAQDMAYRGGHFSTGFVGLKDLMPTLTEVGRHDLACRILLNEDFPSWGYQIRHGATTTWERWDGWTEELGLQTPAMNSFNHYAFGAVGEWMYSHLAGIDTADAGYGRIRIRPHPDARIRTVRARYRAVTGWVSSETIVDAREGKLTVRCRVPVGATATVELPVSSFDGVTESGKPLTTSSDVKLATSGQGRLHVEVGSGHYDFTMPWG